MGNKISTVKKTDPIAKCDEIKEGERKIVDVSMSDDNKDIQKILITNVDNQYYAINTNCPHLNMSMAAGKIKTNDTGNPTIVCGWHGSEFNLKDGSCKKWCKGPGAYLGSKETNAIAYKTRIDNNCVYLDW